MCLSISWSHYDHFTKKYIAETAKCDLEVSKALVSLIGYKKVNGEKIKYNAYSTPFQGVEVKFKDGKCLQKASGNGAHLTKRAHWAVNQGIHSVLKKTHFRSFSNSKWYHAVIPKGTNFFLGEYDDVVSEKLLVFETDKDYEDYCKNNEVKTEWWYDYCSKNEKTV